MNNIFNNNSILEGKGYPLYTKKLMDRCKFYIKDGELIKNRGDMFTTLQEEILNFNNIIIETNKDITIYCNKDKQELYQNEINWLANHYGNFIKDRIKIISR